MKREPILRHDDDSVTIEGDGREYLQHLSDHQKGKGDDEEHCDQYGHDDMHNIPHNESPVKAPHYTEGGKETTLSKAYNKHLENEGEAKRVTGMKSDPHYLEKKMKENPPRGN